jgi:hypothetical protein
MRQFDQRIGLNRAFAQALEDPRDTDLTIVLFQVQGVDSLRSAPAPTHQGTFSNVGTPPATAIA